MNLETKVESVYSDVKIKEWWRDVTPRSSFGLLVYSTSPISLDLYNWARANLPAIPNQL